MPKPLRERSPLAYVLLALVPYSRPNMLLSFRPGLFFAELEKISKHKKSSLKKAYQRAVSGGYVEIVDDQPRLTLAGSSRIKPFEPTKLRGNVKLMAIYDIPEIRAKDRHLLRYTLATWGFRQVQKSVWTTNQDYKDALVELVHKMRLENYVEIYESHMLFPPAKYKEH